VAIPPALQRKIERLSLITPTRWLIVAAVFHVTLALTFFLIGRFHLAPGIFDDNGIGVPFAIDGTTYLYFAKELVDGLWTGGPSSWFSMAAPFHCRLYSLTFIFPGCLLGYNTLSAEPLNLIYYLGTLSFLYLLAKELFNHRAGLLSAIIVGLWPSFLLHSTQLIRDSLFCCLMLAFVYLLTILLRSRLSLRRTVVAVILGLILIVVLWLIRGNWWNLIVAQLVLTLVLLSIRMFRERIFPVGNLVVLTAIFITALLIPTRIKVMTVGGSVQPTPVFSIPSSSRPASSNSLWSRFVTQIRARRGAFRVYTFRQSDIDSDVVFNDAGDIVKFLPRAAVIGFFAPFPKMWVESGTGGRMGRLLSGLETFGMYLLYLPAAFCLWKGRRNLALWLTFLSIFIGLVALGLVVVNAGALYRFRYILWIFTIAMAADGLVRLWDLRIRPKSNDQRSTSQSS
jgi:hypothetical protein